jgi:hypothetical protein
MIIVCSKIPPDKKHAPCFAIGYCTACASEMWVPVKADDDTRAVCVTCFREYFTDMRESQFKEQALLDFGL